ncbi:hypothetical protein GR160_01095 [Flavobacterium sp. Sd200]|uniref:hypothetical protein n=1 Tax=Flavobacterium sp. Sd200 TaxID=2692211 RepID=UPI00136C5819|nr:hypothetical protein [Flavobacterium sp. Sd200]MXN89811.1 hypothetical protein [Flavobacterium sp. Sd200]
MKKNILVFPEFFFLAFSLYWLLENLAASGHVNYFAITAALLFLFQIFFQKRIVGLAVGIVVAIFSLFMLLAVCSEFNDFPVGSADGLDFLITGAGVFIFSFFTASAMVYKYAKAKPALKMPYTT